MRLGIMQPYFFPYFEHFRLIAACDLWVVFDTVAYRRKTWMTRNRVLDRNTGWGYVTAPVVRPDRDTRVESVRLASHLPWRDALADRLRPYSATAPHYPEVMELVAAVLAGDHNRLVDLNVAGLEAVCRWLDISTPIVRLSDLDLRLPDCGPGEWALRISQALGASEYRNPVGGRDLFDPGQFTAAGIDLSFHEPIEVSYETPGFTFVPHLSVLDAMMWVERDMLRSWAGGRGSEPAAYSSASTSSR